MYVPGEAGVNTELDVQTKKFKTAARGADTRQGRQHKDNDSGARFQTKERFSFPLSAETRTF